MILSCVLNCNFCKLVERSKVPLQIDSWAHSLLAQHLWFVSIHNRFGIIEASPACSK